MSTRIGTVASLWRYPVKSMRGEELEEIRCGFAGLQGDRLFAFESSAARKDFPYFTGRQKAAMLGFRPYIRPCANNALPNECTVEVELPDGKMVAIDSPQLIAALRDGAGPEHELTLLHSERGLADAYPISIFSLQTVAQLGEELGMAMDKRRFRANIYLDLSIAEGFAENAYVGRSLRIGDTAVVSIEKRDVRCMMINIDPDTLIATPAVLKQVAQAHAAAAGVYGSVEVEGRVRKGDAVELLD